MRQKRWFTLGCLMLLWAGAVTAGDILTLRLVEASNRGKGVGEGLGDVAPLLSNNLPFSSFKLVAAQSLPMPANGTVDMGYGFSARCTGRQSNLRVAVARRGRPVLQSTVELQTGMPLILGGFPTETGKMIVILVVR